MTIDRRSKLISHLNCCLKVGTNPRLLRKDVEEIIEALKCKPSTDAVSREDVKKFIESFIHEIITESGTDKNAHTNEVLREVARGVGDIPPVTPERPKGEWIRVDNTKCKCSKCEVIHMIAQYPAGHIDWCPNCGTDMRGVKE